MTTWYYKYCQCENCGVIIDQRWNDYYDMKDKHNWVPEKWETIRGRMVCAECVKVIDRCLEELCTLESPG